MPNVSRETVSFQRTQRRKLKERMNAIAIRMDQISGRLMIGGTGLPPSIYDSLISEYRVLERNYDIAEDELKNLG